MDVVFLETGTEIKNVALQQSIIKEDDFKTLEESAEREPVEIRLIVTYKDKEITEAKFDSLRPSAL